MFAYHPGDIKELDYASIMLFYRQFDISDTDYFLARTNLRKSYIKSTGDKTNNSKVILNYYMNKYTEELLTTMFMHLLTTPRWTDRDFVINHLPLLASQNSYVKDLSDKAIVEEDVFLPQVSYDELLQHIDNMLKIFDPSLKWSEEFQKAILNNRIIDKEALKREDIDFFESIAPNNFNMILNGEQTVILDRKGNLTDIPIAVHEVIHYLSNCIYPRKAPFVALNEFPSCFYEILSKDYLKSLGYSEQVINKSMEYRYDTFRDVYTIMYKYLLLLGLAVNKGVITYQDIKEYNAQEREDRRIDKMFLLTCINNMSYNELCYIGEIPYIYGYALAHKYYEEYKKDPGILVQMKELTDSLYQVDSEKQHKKMILQLSKAKK